MSAVLEIVKILIGYRHDSEGSIQLHAMVEGRPTVTVSRNPKRCLGEKTLAEALEYFRGGYSNPWVEIAIESSVDDYTIYREVVALLKRLKIKGGACKEKREMSKCTDPDAPSNGEDAVDYDPDAESELEKDYRLCEFAERDEKDEEEIY